MRPILLLPAMTTVLALTACEPAVSRAGTEPATVETEPIVMQTAPAVPDAPDAPNAPDAHDAPNAPDSSDAATTTVAAMLVLAEAGEWGDYVDTYYGEAHKFRGPEDRNALVARFEQKWGPVVLEGLRKAANLAPEIDEQGRAVFSADGTPVFMLYPTNDGRWTFHL